MIDVILERHVGTSGVQYPSTAERAFKIHTTRGEQCHNAVIVDRAHFIG